ncbi:MAG: hypothetical protein WBA39_10535 [Rivularia sp. (in: cyanobacteria)]
MFRSCQATSCNNLCINQVIKVFKAFARVYIPKIDNLIATSTSKYFTIWNPGIEIPYDGERNPHGYMKAFTATLSALTGYNQKTIEGWFDGKSYHYSVGILLRCFHLIFKD